MQAFHGCPIEGIPETPQTSQPFGIDREAQVSWAAEVCFFSSMMYRI